jgi:hypothetical protein
MSSPLKPVEPARRVLRIPRARRSVESIPAPVALTPEEAGWLPDGAANAFGSAQSRRWRLARAITVRLVAYAALAYTAWWLAPVSIVFYIAVPAAYLVVFATVAHARYIARLRDATPVRLPVSPDVLAPFGVALLEVRVGPPGMAPGISYRHFNRAWLILSPFTISDRAYLQFVFGHESAHAIRNDTLRFRLDVALTLALVTCAVVGLDALVVAEAVVVAGIWRVASRWRCEVACDSAAVRARGIADMTAFMEALTAEPRPLPRQALDLLAHPPMSWRLRWQVRRA